MKQRPLLFTLGMLFGLLPLAMGQGWERDYPMTNNYFINGMERPNGEYLIDAPSFGYLMVAQDGEITKRIPSIPRASNQPNSSWSWSGGHFQFNGQNEVLLARDITILSNNNNEERIQLVKFDSEDSIQWNVLLEIPGDPDIYRILGFSKAATGYYLLLSTPPSTNDLVSYDLLLIKLSEEGQVEWTNSFERGFRSRLFYFLQHPGDEHSLITRVNDGQTDKLNIMRVGSAGALLWEKQFNLEEGHESVSAISDASGLIFIDFVELEASFSDPKGQYLIKKLDSDGEIIGQGSGFLPHAPVGSLALARSGTHFMLVDNGRFGFYVMKINEQGEQFWTRTFRHPFTYALYFAVSVKDNQLLIGGKHWVNPFVHVPGEWYRPFMMKMDSLGRVYPNTIFGNLFDDQDENCLWEDEDGQASWPILLEGERGAFTLTDEAGDFAFQVPEGSFELQAVARNPYWEGCVESYELSVGMSDSVEQNLPIRMVVECPYLEVDIGTPRLRRCFENTYTVGYCNSGTASAEDAYIEIELAPELEFISATVPLSQDGQLLTVPLGNVEPGSCDGFQFDVLLNCDSTELGQTHCVEARIYPDSLCLPTTNWSGASVEVDAQCLGDSIRFFIRNVGTAPTSIPVNYIIVEDQVILRTGNAGSLGVGQTYTTTIASNGGTYFLGAEQEPNHPGNDRPSVMIQGCGGGQGVQLELFHQFPPKRRRSLCRYRLSEQCRCLRSK